MPVIGAVFHLCADPALRAEGVRQLGSDARVTLGELQGSRLPVVVETASRQEDDRFWQELQAVPGIDQIVIAFADVSDVSGAHASTEV